MTGLRAGANGTTNNAVLNQANARDSLGDLTGRSDANGDGSTGAVTESETFTDGDPLDRLTR